MATMPVFTDTKPTTREWAIDDDVTGLRVWSMGMVRELPTPPHADASTTECTIGADPACTIQLDDPLRQVSRLHARVVHDRTGWRLYDVGSKNGLRIDGVRRAEVVLQPGVEIGIGGLTLIAESRQLTALRGFLARLVGWSAECTGIVDHALRSVRMAVTGRAPLVLCGPGDLVPIARAIHRRALGEERPFVVCDPRRQNQDKTVRSALTYPTGQNALVAAAGGSLCVRSRRLPHDFDTVAAAMRDPGSLIQFVVCTDDPAACNLYRATPIMIPPLAGRFAELDRIIDAYFADARRELAVPYSAIQPDDRAWVRRYARSLPAVEKATLRLVALRASRTLSAASERLGMAPVSLSRWMGRRRPPLR